MSAGQPGGPAGGLNGIGEAVLQLQHRAGERQVKGAKLAVTTGYGMTIYRYGGTGAAANVPAAAYQSTQGGTFQLKLSGPAGTNFDLVLYRWNGSAWVVAAQSKSAGSTESITYSGAAGYYYAKVSSVSGAGAYTLTYTFPK